MHAGVDNPKGKVRNSRNIEFLPRINQTSNGGISSTAGCGCRRIIPDLILAREIASPLALKPLLEMLARR